MLWAAVRRSGLREHKFRRQAVIDNRIVDFFCPQKALIVEIDGDTHDPERDRLADQAMLERHQFATLRFTNDDVMRNLDGVLEKLALVLDKSNDRWPHPATTPQHPPLKRRGSFVATAIRAAAERLAATSDTARLDAEFLMAHALGVSRSDMLLKHQRDAVPEGFEVLVTRRRAHEPLAYITGEQEFFGRSFVVTPDVLIPRSDSEQVVEAALGVMSGDARVLDCGTGSGALLLTLLAELPQAGGVGIDASLGALEVAAANAARLGVNDRARIVHANWHETTWADDLGQFDLVIANPPYVEADAPLDASVRDYEPAQALFAGKDGLDDYRVLIPQLSSLLLPGGVAVLEIGATQAEAVAAIAAAEGAESELKRDLAGRPRAMILRWGVGKARIKG